MLVGHGGEFKPSDAIPLSPVRLAQIYTEAGLPNDVFNAVQRAGSSVGPMLTDDPRIDKNSNTGGVPASKFSLKEVTMELGG